MSTQGQGDGGVYFSTRGPASYGLGSHLYEDNIIVDCYGTVVEKKKTSPEHSTVSAAAPPHALRCLENAAGRNGAFEEK